MALDSPSPAGNPANIESIKGIENLADPGILARIDKLIEWNIGHYVNLTQIIVVGDQSSGKSSVLQGITDLPFPRDAGLCTRFATKITFRRSSESSISVSIIPAKHATQEHADKVRAWSKSNLTNLDPTSFAEIMREVHLIMNLSDKNEDSGNRQTFSEDILSLEVCGPDRGHFSVIDVPGIFKKTTEGLTTKEDMQVVTEMVKSYMANKRSVILAVVPANVDIATQDILTMAEIHDPEGTRTLGVLTKPDLVDRGAEQSIVDLLHGKSHRLALGWCLVRNLGQKELADAKDRHAVERSFFRTTAPWNTIENDRLGIASLQIRLQEILAELTRREFPKVKQELHKKLAASKLKLEALGPKRSTPAEQAKYLTEMASRFQDLTTQALSARYYADDLFDKHTSLKIATHVVNRNELLSDMFAKVGHMYEFNLSGKADSSESTAESKPVKGTSSQVKIHLEPRTLNTRTVQALPEIEEIMHQETPITAPIDSGILDWLKKVYRESRGFELGSFDPLLLAITMKEQSSKWPNLALGYVSDVVAITHEFITCLLERVCPDSNIRERLMSILMDAMLERYEKAFEQVKFILEVERSKTPATLNHYFNENLDKSRKERFQKVIESMRSGKSDSVWLPSLQDLAGNHPMSNSDHVVQCLHDILEAYYKVARKRIVDVICMQATEHYLLSGPDTPLKLFSPTFVGGLNAERLEDIAGEDATVKRKRNELEKTIKDLEKGKSILT